MLEHAALVTGAVFLLDRKRCQRLTKADGFNRLVEKTLHLEEEILGITQLMNCKNGDAEACVQLTIDFYFNSKLKELQLALRELDHVSGGTMGCLVPNSFAPETLVLMKDGKLKPIKDIRPGDEVEAADPKTGRHTGTRRVTALLVHKDDDLIDLTLHNADGKTTVVHTTSRHPFWDESSHTWVPAGHLTPGHDLTTPDGSHARIITATARPGTVAMYNLTIEQLHTYYILAGTTPILVHNDDPLPTQLKGRNRPLTSKQATDLAEYLGYRDTGKRFKGQKIFTNGKTVISQDIGNGDGSHNGGTWKIAKDIKALSSKSSRTATTDALLTPIGC